MFLFQCLCVGLIYFSFRLWNFVCALCVCLCGCNHEHVLVKNLFFLSFVFFSILSSFVQCLVVLLLGFVLVLHLMLVI
jgi:hypothetical protein